MKAKESEHSSFLERWTLVLTRGFNTAIPYVIGGNSDITMKNSKYRDYTINLI